MVLYFYNGYIGVIQILLTLAHSDILPRSFRMQPQTNNWTFHNDSHGTLVNTLDQFHPPCSSLSPRVKIFPKPTKQKKIVRFSSKYKNGIWFWSFNEKALAVKTPRPRLNDCKFERWMTLIKLPPGFRSEAKLLCPQLLTSANHHIKVSTIVGRRLAKKGAFYN